MIEFLSLAAAFILFGAGALSACCTLVALKEATGIGGDKVDLTLFFIFAAVSALSLAGGVVILP